MSAGAFHAKYGTRVQAFFQRASQSFFARSALVAASGVTLACTSQYYHRQSLRADSEKSEVYTWGFNRYGQLGIGSEDDVSLPTLISSLNDKRVVFVSCGAEQSAVITDEGELYTFGRGQDSRLGHGRTAGANETSPKLVEELGDKRLVFVNAGYMHMAAITDNGEVWTWGKNTHKQLGRSGPGEYPNPVTKLQELGVRAVQVSCGRYHTVVLTDKGACYAWGGYKSGETGTGEKRSIEIPTKVQIEEPVVQVATGQQFSLFRTAKGQVYSCGAQDQGQTGQGSTRERFIVTPTRIIELESVTKIAAGQFHSVACTADGDVYTWGLNREGQLGHGDTQNRTTPQKVLALSASVESSEWRVLDVAAGGGHTACICEHKKTGKRKLFTFGRGRQGQIGRANKVESVAAYRAEPVEVDYLDTVGCQVSQVDLGFNHSAALCSGC